MPDGTAPEMRADHVPHLPEPPPSDDEPRWRRRLRRTVAALLLLSLGLVGVALPVVVFPDTRPVPGESDAVVLLAGGGGERAETARRVMPRGEAELLLLSGGQARSDWDDDAHGGCGDMRRGYRIECFEPTLVTTRGEARAVARLAERRDWERLTVLTSTPHVARARLLFERCVDADIEMVAASPQNLGARGWVEVSARELAGLVREGLLWRGC